jgi:hypothetical protein
MNRIFILLIPLVFSCESKPKETLVNDENIEVLELAEKKIAERKAKGDTLAISDTELEKFLPQSIEAYVADGNTKGQTYNESGMSWSYCEKTYIKGNDKLTIKLADYNGAYGMFAGASAIYASGTSIDNEEEKSKNVIINNGKIKGWESYKKNTGESSLIAGIGDRFLLTIEADNQKNSDLVRSVAEAMDLEALKSR